MSMYKVPVTTIKAITEHPNAHSLEFATVYGFTVVVQKGKYKVGDKAIYVPIDSVIPNWLEEKLFPADSKIKLNKGRIKQIKIRGAYSQGMLIPLEAVNEKISFVQEEQDLAEILGITKYEPPAASYQGTPKSPRSRNRALENPYFHKYGGLDNYKWYPDLFKPGELVSVTEKLHGTHFRAGYVPFVANTLMKKIKKFFRLTPSHEFVFGSNNVQLQERPDHQGFYDENVYAKMVTQYELKERLKPGEVIHGEIIGAGIQKDYDYGVKDGHKLVLFDLKIQTEASSEFVNVLEFDEFCKKRGFERVPELYRGEFDEAQIKALTLGNSRYCPQQKVREGVVVKPMIEEHCYMGRKVLKLISEKYLEGDQTDFH